LLGAVSLDLFAVLLGGATALLPVYARDILKVGPVGFGILRSAPAAGAIITALVLARHDLRHRVGARLFVAVAIFGVATIVFGLSHNFVLSFIALVVTGAADQVSVYIRSAVTQLATPDSMRGRVNAVYMVFVGASNELGAFESGLAASLLGTIASVVFGGVGTIIVAALWTKLFPALRNVDSLQGVQEFAEVTTER
jgi:MFS family permease